MVRAWLQSAAGSPSPPTGRFSADSLPRQIVLLPVHQSTTLINGYKDKFHLILKARRWWKRSLQKERDARGGLCLGLFWWSEGRRGLPGEQRALQGEKQRGRLWCGSSVKPLQLCLFPNPGTCTQSKTTVITAERPISLLRSLLQQKGGPRAHSSTFFTLTYRSAFGKHSLGKT